MQRDAETCPPPTKPTSTGLDSRQMGSAMLTDARDNDVGDPAVVPWDLKDKTERQATLLRILVRISREALQGASLDSLMQGICDCLVAELPVAIVSVLLLDDDN